MANCLDYAKIAFAAYFTGAGQYYEEPAGHMVDDWVCQHWKTGGFFSTGFQGGIWQSSDSVVVGCCGTNPQQKGKFLADLSADLRIGLKILPNQCDPARKMVRMAKQIANGRPVSVTGHSLGGGLAQVVGLWEQVPFVTFNAPAMRQAMHLARVNIFKPQMAKRTAGAMAVRDAAGMNFRITGDAVSTSLGGDHVGTVVVLDNTTGKGAHGKGNIWQSVLQTDWANIDPFEVSPYG